MPTPYAAWLRSLDEHRLTALLRARPDGCAEPVPRDLDELADRLMTRHSYLDAARRLDATALQVLDVVAACSPTAEQLGRHVVGETVSAAAQLELGRVRLLEAGLCFEDGERLRVPDVAYEVLPPPMGLGPPLADVLDELGQHWITTVRTTLGVNKQSSWIKTARAVADRLDEPTVTALIDEGGPAVRELLHETLRAGSLRKVADLGSYLSGPTPWRPRTTLAWALDRGLLLPVGYDCVALPREVGLAILGTRWSVTVGEPPVVTTAAVDDALLARESAAAVTATVGGTADLLDLLQRSPAAELQSGGIGVRELRRIGKALGRDEAGATLLVELADAAGLLGLVDGRVTVSGRGLAWRDATAAEQAADLVRAWWRRPGPVTAPVEDGGRRSAPASMRMPAPEYAELRAVLLEVLAELPDGYGAVDAAAAAGSVSWRMPLLVPDDVTRHAAVTATWTEATALGVLAMGRLTALGGALRTGDDEALGTAAAALVPASRADVFVQADLSVVATGAVPRHVASLLDGCADREASRGSTTWRLSAASVRRALDAGTGADDLIGELQALSTRPLPQALEYLVRDVARRHGELVVTPARCVVVARDAALAAEVVRVKSLKALRLAEVAPAVLVSAAPPQETLEALRAAGYAPVSTTDGGVALERQAAPASPDATLSTVVHDVDRSLRRRRRTQPPEQVARQLLAAPPRPASPSPAPRGGQRDRLAAASTTEESVAAMAPHLRADAVRLMAHAVDERQPVLIRYRSSSGSVTERVVSDLVLWPPFVDAYCHLRQDQRTFTVSSILDVAPA